MDTTDVSPSYLKAFNLQLSSGPLTFTEEHRRKNLAVYHQMKEFMPFADRYRLSDCDLIYRFLIGKHWHVEESVKSLKGYLEMREGSQLESLLGKPMEPGLECVVAKVYGEDLEGCPVLWFRPDPPVILAALKQFGKQAITSSNIYQMEQARCCSRVCNQQRCTYVMDLACISMTTLKVSTMDIVRDLVKVLQLYYPEIMRRLIICNSGWTITTAWKMLKPFVDSRVQDKVKFINEPPSVACLSPYMTASNVPEWYGGSAPAGTDKMKRILEEEAQRILNGEKLRPLAEHGGDAADVAPPLSSTDEDMDNESLFSCADSFTLAYPDHSLEAELKRLVICNQDVLDKEIEATMAGESVTMKDEVVARPATDDQNRVLTPPHSDAAKLARTHLDSSPSASRAMRHEVEGLARRSSGGEASYFERCLQLSLVYTNSEDEVISYCKKERCATYRNGRVFADYHLRSFDNDDQSGHSCPLQQEEPPQTAVTQQQQEEVDDPTASGESTTTATVNDSKPSIQDIQRLQDRLPGVFHVDPVLRTPVLCGEVLEESGHYLHPTLLVCDGDRRVNFILKRSRLRTRITVFMITGFNREVRTTDGNLHYFLTGRQPTNAAADSSAKSVEDINRESTYIGTVFAQKASSSGDTRDAWKMVGSEAFKKSDIAGESESDSASRQLALYSKKEHHLRRAVAKWFPLITPLKMSSVVVAEHKQQTLMFYGNLVKWYQPHDLFALGSAITKLWTLDHSSPK